MSEDTVKNITEAQGEQVVKFLKENTTREDLVRLKDAIDRALTTIYKVFPELKERPNE